jgi:GWxTD domain-containing protein
MINTNYLSKITALVLLFSSIFVGIHESLAQNTLENLNQALRYSRYARISPKIIPIQQEGNKILLQMPVEKIEEDSNFEDYTFIFSLLHSFQEPITATNSEILDAKNLKYNTRNHYYFEKVVELMEGKAMAFALLEVKDNRQGDSYYYHVDLKSPFITNIPDFGLYYPNGIPFDQNFIATDAALEVRSKNAITFHKFFYPYQSEVPYPPMETKPSPAPRNIEVKYEGDFFNNSPQILSKEGYYFIQADTNSTTGLLMKTTKPTFPKVGTWDEMIEMVGYISTRKEHETLLKAEDKKKALDRYWIEVTKNPEAAKVLIKEYFRQIEFANILFTDTREGWKTDRGMVYTIMGPPDEVYFRLNAEVWNYGNSDSNSKITFTFVRVKNILTPNYYSLNRTRLLQPEWFRSITTWRSGEVAF